MTFYWIWHYQMALPNDNPVMLLEKWIDRCLSSPFSEPPVKRQLVSSFLNHPVKKFTRQVREVACVSTRGRFDFSRLGLIFHAWVLIFQAFAWHTELWVDRVVLRWGIWFPRPKTRSNGLRARSSRLHARQSEVDSTSRTWDWYPALGIDISNICATCRVASRQSTATLGNMIPKTQHAVEQTPETSEARRNEWPFGKQGGADLNEGFSSCDKTLLPTKASHNVQCTYLERCTTLWKEVRDLEVWVTVLQGKHIIIVELYT
jgi:hypothetical protein